MNKVCSREPSLVESMSQDKQLVATDSEPTTREFADEIKHLEGLLCNIALRNRAQAGAPALASGTRYIFTVIADGCDEGDQDAGVIRELQIIPKVHQLIYC